MSKLIPALCLVALVAFMVPPVGAVSADEEELARALRRQYGGLTSWEAVMTFADSPGVSVHVWQSRGRWRQEWTFPAEPSGASHNGSVADSGEAFAVAVGMDGRVVASCLEGDFALSPLMLWMPAGPVDRWKAWGVDIAERSYGFCGDAPCLMLGAEPGDAVGPAVWLHNEDMAPLMVRYRDGRRMVEIQFAGYLTLSGFRLPGQVNIRVGDAATTATVRWIAINRADGEALYARDNLGSRPCAVPPPPFDLLRDAVRHPSPE
ncbi:hypothetical protein GKC30_04390 [Pseudodesulfovibrio sp. F-1]|uniref:Outer membrane lipoprotein-sorting protein-like protein n=1 Tax=Pseudodesulfovibrio alkaliphilus TaxID=2661613 RepID=A0A7K1KLC2_9BACT|nr:hypothetical protein [Pseudodesulfovibrio alkaliphilus]MUM76869.1 hypothetical protein [Pseudodesulfovibrio alkaliphilus]